MSLSGDIGATWLAILVFKYMDRKFFIYPRKSTDTEDRQVRSISDQLAELKSLALKENVEIVDIFV